MRCENSVLPYPTAQIYIVKPVFLTVRRPKEERRKIGVDLISGLGDEAPNQMFSGR